jgi:hypothetical protein
VTLTKGPTRIILSSLRQSPDSSDEELTSYSLDDVLDWVITEEA